MGAKTQLFVDAGAGSMASFQSPVLMLPAAEPNARRSNARRRAQENGAQHAAVAIQAVLFDVDDVFYDASSWCRWLTRVLKQLSPPALECRFAELWQQRFLPPVHCGQQEFYAAFAACLEALGLAAGHVEELVAAGRAQHRRQEGSLRPFPGVRATLSSLESAGISLNVLTNSAKTAAALRRDLARLGVDGAFGHVLTSRDLGAALPEATCYAQALETLHLTAAQTLFVGHDARELHGARAAGLQTVAFNAQQSTADETQIERFEALLELLLPVAATCGGSHPDD